MQRNDLVKLTGSFWNRYTETLTGTPIRYARVIKPSWATEDHGIVLSLIDLWGREPWWCVKNTAFDKPGAEYERVDSIPVTRMCRGMADITVKEDSV